MSVFITATLDAIAFQRGSMREPCTLVALSQTQVVTLRRHGVTLLSLTVKVLKLQLTIKSKNGTIVIFTTKLQLS